MRVEIWGARGSIPTPSPTTVTYGGNTACVSLCSDAGEQLIFDAGSGIRALGQKLIEQAGPAPVAAAILLSHFHWDHILGIPFFTPLYRANNRIAFFSFRHPESSFQEVIEAPMGAPYFPVTMSQMAAQQEFYEVGEQCFQIGKMHVLTRRLNHPQGCLGFRVEGDSRVVTYATDHEPDGGRYDMNLLALAAEADLLILDAQYSREEYEGSRRGWGHGNWENAVELARRAGVKHLLLFHHDPDRSDAALSEIVRRAQWLFPSVDAAAEGTTIYLPEDNTKREAQPGHTLVNNWEVQDCLTGGNGNGELALMHIRRAWGTQKA